MLPVDWSVVDWDLATRFGACAIFSLITARRKEIGKLWQCSKEKTRNTHLRVEISILKHCFIVKLFKKWCSALPPPPVAHLIWATHLGVLACARPCTAHTRLFGLIYTPNEGLCAPSPIAAALLPQKIKKINYFQKQNASLQARTQTARDIYFSTVLSCALLICITLYWAMVHPLKLYCTHWDKLHPSELRLTFLSYASPYMSYAVP
jgi:hypothetical protein